MLDKKIAIIGLGYVGLPLAVAFAEKYSVIGFDISEKRTNELNNGYDSTHEIDTEALKKVSESFHVTTDAEQLSDCNVYIVTVPTPIDSSNMPDLTPLIKASKAVATTLSKGDIVIYESTVYPGVTEDVCVPVLESSSGLKFNMDFYCGYSPERINPGDKKHTVKSILKVTSGSTDEIALKVDELYKSVITAGTFKASSIKVAEASKVIENTQRDVNIALINELSMIFDTMGLDTQEVIEAASTKWNFIKLSPGLVGGHCIGVDPYYLTFKAQEMGYKPNLILSARQINNSIAKHIVDATIKKMILRGINVKDSKILILGATFKENCPDLRNSKVFDLIDEILEYGCSIDIYEPWVSIEQDSLHSNIKQVDDPLFSGKKYDAIIGAVAHDEFLNYSNEDITSMSNEDVVLINVKNIFSKPTWSL
ncbi:nucleotide sugar dehydrogenase [Shewanella woodyi]|uniref:nucleotide sugar dehydrogenase n=1 Tax=Shewanella woodyi TaxID=60961 RepID=UPI0007EBCCB0|nr:nucleotide sugar dehydrogenase [Shewanella woodyi]